MGAKSRTKSSNSVMRALLYSLAVAFGFTFWSGPTHDPDLGWHLLGGSWILSHGRVPSIDIINSFNPEWHDYHWLGQILLFPIFKYGDYEGLRFFLGFVMAYLGKVIVDILLLLKNQQRSALLHLVSFLIVMTLISQVTSIRPQMFSVLFLAITLRRVIQLPTKWEIPFLFLLTVLLVNVHVYWVFIPFIWFSYRVLGTRAELQTLSAPYVFGCLLLFLSAGLFSPYGLFSGFTDNSYLLKNYALLWDYLVMPKELRNAIGELQGALGGEGMRPWLLALFVGLIARSFSWRRLLVRPGIWVSAIVTFILAVRTLKFLSVFAICSLPLLVISLDTAFGSLLRKNAEKAWNVGRYSILAVLTWAIVSAAIYFPWRYDVREYMTSYLPFQACKELAHIPGIAPSHGRDHVRVLTHFNHGGWCRWMVYQENPNLDFRVTVDGRTQWVPPHHYELGFDLYNVKDGWLKTLEEWSPDVALVPKEKPLAQILYRLPDKWKLVYQDDFFGIFVPIKR